MGKINFSKTAAPGVIGGGPIGGTPAAQTPPPPAAVASTPVVAAPAAPVTGEPVKEVAPTSAPNARTVDVTVERTGQPAGSPQVVAPYQAPPSPAFYDGDEAEGFDPGDLVLPHLNIVQKVGDLSNIFLPGTVLLGGQLVLTEAPKEMAVGKTCRIIVLGLQPTTFSEKIEGGGRGNYFRTEQEVVKAGGTLDWNESKATNKPLYQRVSIALIAVEKPEGLDDASFPHEVDGKRYALAMYTMKGTAYTNAARHFKSARKIGHLRKDGYRSAYWTFAAQLKKFGNNYAYIPVPRAAEATTEAFRTELKTFLGF